MIAASCLAHVVPTFLFGKYGDTLGVVVFTVVVVARFGLCGRVAVYSHWQLSGAGSAWLLLLLLSSALLCGADMKYFYFLGNGALMAVLSPLACCMIVELIRNLMTVLGWYDPQRCC